MSMFQRFFFCRDGKADQTAKIQSCGCENCAITPIEALGYFSICFRFFQIHLSLFNHRIPANLCKSPKLNIYSTVFVQYRMVHKGYPCSPSFSTKDGKDNPSCAAYTPVWVHLQNHPLGMTMDNTLIQSPIQYSCKISSSHCSATSTAILNGVYSIHTKRMEYSIMCPISCQFCGASTGFTSITINHPIRTCWRADPIRQQNRFLEESFFKLGQRIAMLMFGCLIPISWWRFQYNVNNLNVELLITMFD